jgi:hypothetical protein
MGLSLMIGSATGAFRQNPRVAYDALLRRENQGVQVVDAKKIAHVWHVQTRWKRLD